MKQGRGVCCVYTPSGEQGDGRKPWESLWEVLPPAEQRITYGSFYGEFCSFLSDEPHGIKLVNSRSALDMDKSPRN